MDELAQRKIMFLRVGIDLGCGGALGPIYPDGSFEYVPIPDNLENESSRSLYYKDLKARSGGTLEKFVPKRFQSHPVHYDPEFGTYTYGDPTKNKKRQLLRLNSGDVLVFYAGLRPWGQKRSGRIYIIGYLGIESVAEILPSTPWPPPKYRHLFANAHLRRAKPDEGLVIVQGKHEKSRLLNKAFLISDKDQTILPEMEKFLGIHGSLKRSIGRWVPEERIDEISKWLSEL